MEHIVVHKDTAFHSTFPHLIRLRNGELVCIFRQARFRQGYADGEARDRSLAHYYLDPDSRIALVRSTDDEWTWDPDSFVVIDASDGGRDLNMGMIAELPSGELMVNNHGWFTGLSEEQGSGLDGKRSHLPQPDSSPYSREWFGGIYYDGVYTLRSTDAGRTWSGRHRRFFTHTGKDGALVMPDGSLLLPLSGHTHRTSHAGCSSSAPTTAA